MIKGQNIRLIVAGRCVAAATSCDLHISAKVENRNTKDTPDSLWDNNEVVGNTWDASVQSLLVNKNKVSEGSVVATDQQDVPQGAVLIPMWLADDQILVPAGCTLVVHTDTSVLYLVSGGEVIDEQASLELTFVAEEDTVVQIGMESEEDIADYSVYDTAVIEPEDIIDILGGGEAVDVRLSLTTGDQHRDEEQNLVAGQALVSDIEIEAQTAATVTFSARLTGTGPLAPDNE